MVLDPNPNWNTRTQEEVQKPVYFARIAGLTTKDYSTHPVRSAAVTKTVLMEPPGGGAFSIDLIGGTRTVQTVTVELLDVGGEITELISTESPNAVVPSLINRLVTIYGGYRELDETDYPAIFTGRCTGLRMSGDLTAYVLRLSDMSFLLDGQIMTDSTDTKPATFRGNIVNVYWSILTGTFSTTDPDFPLVSVSTDTASSSAPTGLAIPRSLINETQLKAERDLWHEEDEVEFEFRDSEAARDFLVTEVFRFFQAFSAISGTGLIGLKFLTPPVAPSKQIDVNTEDHTIQVVAWERQFREHLNRFRYHGDYNITTDTYDTLLYGEDTARDTQNQTDTAEIITYTAESRGVRTALNGEEICEELAGRHRIRYLETPVRLQLETNFTRRAIEQGDVVAVKDPRLPDVLRGQRGLDTKYMTVISIRPDFARGRLRMTLLDTGYNRTGVIAPTGTADYTAATEAEQNTFAWISSETNQKMSNGDPGYKVM